MLVLIRARRVSLDEQFWPNIDGMVISERTDALLRVPDNASEEDIEGYLSNPLAYTGSTVTLEILEPGAFAS